MSELKVPDFMQELLDKIDGDEAYPGMYKLARQYQNELQNIKDKIGNYGDKKDITKVYEQRTNDLKSLYMELALAHAKEHGFKEAIQEEKSLTLAKKLALAKENFKDEDVPVKEIENEQDDKGKKDSPALTKFVVNSNDITKSANPTISKEEERAKLLAEMRAAAERNKSRGDRER
jgi:hypothetical protein